MRPLVLLSALPALVYAASNNHVIFQHFFPTYDDAFQTILRQRCGEMVDRWDQTHDLDDDERTSRLPSNGNWSTDEFTGIFGYNDPENFVVECILAATPEIIKSKMATSQVLLGLMPSLLALLAAGQHQTGLVAIAAGNPILAAFLAAGSPTVSPIQSTDYVNAVDFIKNRRIELPRFMQTYGRIITAAEYVVVLASIANIVHISLTIYQNAMFTFHLGMDWFIFLWAFFGTIVHVLGAVAVSYRIRVVPDPQEKYRRSRIMAFIRRFHLFGRPKALRIEMVRESIQFYAISWLASFLTVMQLFYGTMLFSSILFISVEDSSILLLRFIGSVVFCKLVIMYELFYLQGVVTIHDETS